MASELSGYEKTRNFLLFETEATQKYAFRRRSSGYRTLTGSHTASLLMTLKHQNKVNCANCRALLFYVIQGVAKKCNIHALRRYLLNTGFVFVDH